MKGSDQDISFRMEDKGPIISIKFSPDMNILAIQRSTSSVEFVNYSASAVLDGVEYSQTCKKNASILGFVWTHGNEILFVTDHGVELFLVRSNWYPNILYVFYYFKFSFFLSIFLLIGSTRKTLYQGS